MSRNSFMYSLILFWSDSLHAREDYSLSYCGRRVWLLWCEMQRLLNWRMNALTWPALTDDVAVFHDKLLSSCCVGPGVLHGGQLSSSWLQISAGIFSPSLHFLDFYCLSSPLTFCRGKKHYACQQIQIFSLLQVYSKNRQTKVHKSSLSNSPDGHAALPCSVCDVCWECVYRKWC